MCEYQTEEVIKTFSAAVPYQARRCFMTGVQDIDSYLLTFLPSLSFSLLNVECCSCIASKKMFYDRSSRQRILFSVIFSVSLSLTLSVSLYFVNCSLWYRFVFMKLSRPLSLSYFINFIYQAYLSYSSNEANSTGISSPYFGVIKRAA